MGWAVGWSMINVLSLFRNEGRNWDGCGLDYNELISQKKDTN